jgi:hypothetical protein
MKKLNSFTYDVKVGEHITISVTPTNFGGSATDVEAVLDGEDLANTGTDSAPLFEFDVTKAVGRTHRVLMEFVFFADAPPTSFYQVDISGENDQGCPCGFIIDPRSQVKEAGIRFRVKA